METYYKDNLINDKSSEPNSMAHTFEPLNRKNNDNYSFPNMSIVESSFHNHRIQSIIANQYLSNTAVQLYSDVSAQLKSTFNQISRQSISLVTSSPPTAESSTCSSLSSSIAEILTKSNESLLKPTENLPKSEGESFLDQNDDERIIFKSNENPLNSNKLILKSTPKSLFDNACKNFFKCQLSIEDKSELNNLISSSSSLDSSSFEKIYSIYPSEKLSIDESKKIYESKLKDNQPNESEKQILIKKTKQDDNINNLTKNIYLNGEDCSNCQINFIELSTKDHRSLTISIKWHLNRKNIIDKKFSLQFRPVTKHNQRINVHIKY